MSISQRPHVRRENRSRGALKGAIALVAALMLAVAVPVSAEAVNWYTWRTNAMTNYNGTWYGVNTGAQYNQARIRTYSDQANAEVFVSGVGTSSAPSQVIQTFGGYRTVSGQCRWYSPLVPTTTPGHLDCALGY